MPSGTITDCESEENQKKLWKSNFPLSCIVDVVLNYYRGVCLQIWAYSLWYWFIFVTGSFAAFAFSRSDSSDTENHVLPHTMCSSKVSYTNLYWSCGKFNQSKFIIFVGNFEMFSLVPEGSINPSIVKGTKRIPSQTKSFSGLVRMQISTRNKYTLSALHISIYMTNRNHYTSYMWMNKHAEQMILRVDLQFVRQKEPILLGWEDFVCLHYFVVLYEGIRSVRNDFSSLTTPLLYCHSNINETNSTTSKVSMVCYRGFCIEHVLLSLST